MAHYAYVDDTGTVTSVIVGRDEDDLEPGITSWEEYFTAKGKGQAVRTSYNTRGGVHYTDGEPSADQSKALRGNYAGVGFTYLADEDIFMPPKPFESWVLNVECACWEAPIPKPEDGGEYTWDEATTDWVEVPDEAV